MAASRHHTASSEPLSIAEITAQAQAFDWNPSVAIQRWIRAAKLLLTEATICERDGNLQSAFLYLYRHAELVLDRLPKHPDYHDPAFKAGIAIAKKAVMRNLQKLETWKPVLRQQHERYRAAVEKRDAAQKRVQQEQTGLQALDGLDPEADYGLDYDDYHHLNVHDNSALAVDLAHREIRKRDASRQSTRQAGIPPGTVASRRRGIVVAGEDATGDGSRDTGVRDVGGIVQGTRQPSRDGPARRQPPSTSNTYNYPSVPARERVMDWNTPALQPLSSRNHDNIPPPSRPAKERFDDSDSPRPTPPPKQQQQQPSLESTTTPSTHLSKYTFTSTTTTESGQPLRPLLLPPQLRQTFLNLAHPNTLSNLETCAILAATPISNALFISHLILPDQVSTPNTCDTTPAGDTALFDYCDAHELLVCGWIHTHPSQTCFLSSRDLHTSSGYQVMLPEAIAIVCSPRHNPEWGCFRLTSPPGLQAVLGCQAPGVFHPHAERDLYTDALRPGHVVEGKGLEFEVVDLRGR